MVLTPEEHKAKHVELHTALDQLFADYITHHPEESNFTDMPLIKLLRWSAQQAENPTEDE